MAKAKPEPRCAYACAATVFVAAFACLLAACSATHEQQLFDKNTNWLERCDSTRDCDQGLDCKCGVCTLACDSQGACSGFAGAVCASMGDACSATQVCTARCDNTTSCADRNPGLQCSGRACRSAISTALGDAGTPDASATSTMLSSLPRVAEDGFGQALTQAYCGWMRRCCQQAGFSAEDPTCEDAPPILAPSPDAHATYDVDAGTACVAAFNAAECRSAKVLALMPPECQGVYRGGQFQIDDACQTSWECAGGAEGNTYCAGHVPSPGVVVGVCKALSIGKLGDSCGSSGYCEPDLLCNDQLVCVERANRGEVCLTGTSWGDTCAQGSVCDRRMTQRCVAPKPVGAPCEQIEECESLACVGGICREPNWAVPLCVM